MTKQAGAARQLVIIYMVETEFEQLEILCGNPRAMYLNKQPL